MSDRIVDQVNKQYSSVAGLGLSSQQEGIRQVAEAFGYTSEQLQSIPAEANMGLSCGNPTATANLRPGEVVVDLGCGGGLDVFLAARKVGPQGRAIGIDMSEEMLAVAKRNAQQGPDGKPWPNVEFQRSTIDQLPLEDASVDCILSNCVINLAPDKPRVFAEMHRVLRPGGRLAISDIALKKPLPEDIQENLAAYIGCISGAILVDAYRDQLRAAGFSDVEVVDTGADLNAYAKAENAACCVPSKSAGAADLPTVDPSSGCCGGSPAEPGIHGQLADLLRRYNINEFAGSFRIYAIKAAQA